MTVELDDRYAKAKERIRRTDDELLKDQFRTAYGDDGDLMLARMTTFNRHPRANESSGRVETRSSTRSRAGRAR